MVTRSERAQLILIGALLLATIVFGLSFLLNSLLFNSAGATSPATASVTEAEGTDFEAQRSLRTLAVRVNHERRNVTAPDLNATFSSNLTRFARLLAESKAAAGATAVSLDFHNDSSGWGYRIVQTHDADFSPHSGINNWDPVPDSPDTAVGWFTMNINATSPDIATMEANAFAMEAQNDTATLDVVIWKKNNNNVSIKVDGGPTKTCEGIDGRVLLDLYRGQVHSDDCEFRGVRTLGNPVKITFQDPDELVGRYSIVMNRSNGQFGSDYLRCTNGGTGRPPTNADPCVAPALWTANLTTTVNSDRLAYENRFNLSIYGGES